MSKDLIAFDSAQLPANLADKFGASSADDLIASSAGFPVLSIRASKWRVKVSGEEMPLIDSNDDAVPSIELVIIKAAKVVTKNYYAKKYQEGDDAAPDCFSNDGDLPASDAPNPQCDSCVSCPHNQWGSRISDSGSKAKACSDSKALAVTFTGDMDNEALGGPMLLRVPPASLKDLSTFARALKAKGFVPQQISIRVGFDMAASYPKLTFKAVRPLKVAEIQKVAELFDLDQVNDIVHEGYVAQQPVAKPTPVAAKPAPKKQEPVDAEFEDVPTAAVVPTPAKPAAAPKPAVSAVPRTSAKPTARAKPVVAETPSEPPKVAKRSPEPVASPEVDTRTAEIQSDIDDILGELDGL